MIGRALHEKMLDDARETALTWIDGPVIAAVKAGKRIRFTT